jgi:hypothetical protein
MKTPRLIIAVIIVFVLIAACKHASYEETSAFQNDHTVTDEAANEGMTAKGSSEPCNPYAYEVALESRTLVNGNWEWVWSVRNPNPGNGNNGTAKDLSHWGMQLAACLNLASITDAAYSGDGAVWTSFIPVNQSDASQDCLTTPTLKFDFGTTGSAKSYYRLTLSQQHPVDNAIAYYKSGQSCCTFAFTGIGCGGVIEIVE